MSQVITTREPAMTEDEIRERVVTALTAEPLGVKFDELHRRHFSGITRIALRLVLQEMGREYLVTSNRYGYQLCRVAAPKPEPEPEPPKKKTTRALAFAVPMSRLMAGR
jgi:hypothetical protein